MSMARMKPFYVSLGMKYSTHVTHGQDEIYNPALDPRSSIRAIINEQYDHNIVEKASDYLIAVERLEISLNGIPFYDATPHEAGGGPPLERNEIIYVVPRNPAFDTTTQVLETNAYSLSHLFTILNSYTFTDPAIGDSFKVTFTMDKDGFVILRLLDRLFTDFYFVFPRRLNQILGISTEVQEIAAYQAVSAYPRIDLGDDLDHLILSSNLPTVSDAIGQARAHILTDFCPPTSYSNGMGYNTEAALYETSLSTNLRQKAIYYPSERRFLELIGDFPLNQITMQMFYRNTDNDLKEVAIPFGGCFEIKLGFYLKQ